MLQSLRTILAGSKVSTLLKITDGTPAVLENQIANNVTIAGQKIGNICTNNSGEMRVFSLETRHTQHPLPAIQPEL